MIDTQPSEPKTLVELKVKKTSTRAAPVTDGESGASHVEGAEAERGARGSAGGAAEAAGVLTAVDEDDEGAEEAEPPADFDYFSEGEGEGGEE